MTHEMIGFVILLVICVITCIVMIVFEYFLHKQHVKWNTYISEAKTKLENAGFKFNHSYRLVNKLTDTIEYIRIYGIKYSPDKNKVMVHAYIVTKNGEIGTWYDDYNYLLEIPERWNIEDCGEWNPDN